MLPAFADYGFNDEITPHTVPQVKHHYSIILLCSYWPHVVQSYDFNFVVKTLSSGDIAKSTPGSEWAENTGFGPVNINVTLSDNNHNILYKWQGVTNNFGWYKGNIRMLNYPTDQIYFVNITATKPGFNNSTASYFFELYDLRQVGQ